MGNEFLSGLGIGLAFFPATVFWGLGLMKLIELLERKQK